jgi:hypothetical protein
MSIDKNLVYGALDDVFIEAVQKERTWTGVCNRLGISKENRKIARKKAIEMNIPFNHFIKQKISKEELEKIVISSKSQTEVGCKLGITYKLVIKLLSQYNVSTTHFTYIGGQQIKENISDDDLLKISSDKNIVGTLKYLKLSESKENICWLQNRLTKIGIDPISLRKIDWKKYTTDNVSVLNNLLCNKPYGSWMGKNLIKYGFLKNECEECGQKPFHNGKILILQHHHRDGNNKNNAIGNLQVLCPNCHTQTNNYARSKTRHSKVSQS